MPLNPINAPAHRHWPWFPGSVGVALFGLLSAACLVAGGRLIAGYTGAGVVQQELFAIASAHAFGWAGLLWITLDTRLRSTPWPWIVATAAGIRWLALQAGPLLEDDHYRYLWDGLRTATGLDPYRLPPEAWFGRQDLDPLWQAVLNGINHPELPTIYGPVLQGLFGFAHAVEPGHLWPMQAGLLVADLVILCGLGLGGAGRRWLWAYAIHPLVLKEGIASAHPDALVAGALLLAVAAWDRRWAWAVGASLGLALGVKVAALVTLPVLLICPAWASGSKPQRALWAIRVLLGMVAALTLAYLPFLHASSSDWASLKVFGESWRFNPLAVRILERVTPEGLVRFAAAGILLVAIAAHLLRWLADRQTAPPPLTSVLMWLLLLSPVVNPWYWLWILPLAARERRLAPWIVAAFAGLSYLNGTVLAQGGLGGELTAGWEPYAVPWPVTMAQLIVWGLAWRIETSLRKRARAGRNRPWPGVH